MDIDFRFRDDKPGRLLREAWNVCTYQYRREHHHWSWPSNYPKLGMVMTLLVPYCDVSSEESNKRCVLGQQKVCVRGGA